MSDIHSRQIKELEARVVELEAKLERLAKQMRDIQGYGWGDIDPLDVARHIEQSLEGQ